MDSMDGTNRQNDSQIIEHLRGLAQNQHKPSELLRYLTVDLGMTDQVEIMQLFSTSMKVSLGEVTAIAAWWHEGERELTDNDINAYMTPIVQAFATQE